MMMRMRITFVLLLAVLVTSACSRARVSTEIRVGGACTRTISLTGPEKQPEGSMNMGSTIEETFVLPSGPAWKKSEQKGKGDHTLVYERSFGAGTPLKGDLAIKGKGDAPLLSNEVTVTRVAPRRFEYKETIRWQGPAPKDIGIQPEELAKIKAALPQGLGTDENVKALVDRTAVLAMPALFGPGDPLLAMGLFHPDLAVKRINQRIGGLMLTALEQQFGDKIQPQERREIARRLIEITFFNAMPAKPDPAAGPPETSSGGLTPLMFLVKSKGHVVSSNGEVDDLTGEVYWALYPEAASLKPLTLNAIVQLGQ